MHVLNMFENPILICKVMNLYDFAMCLCDVLLNVKRDSVHGTCMCEGSLL